MTSNEALEHLLNLCDYHKNNELVKDCDKTIRKDLKRLEELERAVEIMKWLLTTAEKEYDNLYTLGNLTVQEETYNFLKKVCKG